MELWESKYGWLGALIGAVSSLLINSKISVLYIVVGYIIGHFIQKNKNGKKLNFGLRRGRK